MLDNNVEAIKALFNCAQGNLKHIESKLEIAIAGDPTMCELQKQIQRFWTLKNKMDALEKKFEKVEEEEKIAMQKVDDRLQLLIRTVDKLNVPEI